VIPLETLAFEDESYYYCEDGKGDNLLYYLELHNVERAAVVDKADTIGWNLGAIFKKSQAPRQQNHPD